MRSGAVLVAVLLGPWAAVIAVSVALAIQALFFGDGGVLAFGANCFNMAVVMPFAGYGDVPSARRSGTAHVAAPRASRRASAPTSASTLAALVAAVEFGLQPELFSKTTASGAHVPLYAPFDLSADDSRDGGRAPTDRRGRRVRADRGRDHVPAAGQPPDPADQSAARRRDRRRASTPVERNPRVRGLLLGLGALVALVPLGLLAPGGAFGEDSPADLDLRRYGLDAVPTGLRAVRRLLVELALPGLRLRARRAPDRRATTPRPSSGTLLIARCGRGRGSGSTRPGTTATGVDGSAPSRVERPPV